MPEKTFDYASEQGKNNFNTSYDLDNFDVTFLLPCLNEKETLKQVIKECEEAGKHYSYEIIVADNGSTDGSCELAESLGARVIHVDTKGYGAAILKGIKCSSGECIVMGDSDSTYNFLQSRQMIDLVLFKKYDLVMGNRFKGKIEKNAMPFHHYYIGNPVLSLLGKKFFHVPINDFHCGLRAFNRRSVLRLPLNCTGMEFATELVVKASFYKFEITEVPVDLRQNPPNRVPHLRSWSDGWRHLKFMIALSPKYGLLSLSICSFFVSILLILCFFLRFPPLTGPLTVILSVLFLSVSYLLCVDYLLLKEIHSQYFPANVTPFSSAIRVKYLNLRKNTQKLYRISGLSFLFLLSCSLLIAFQASSQRLSDYMTVFYGYAFANGLLLALCSYLLAAKIDSLKELEILLKND